VPRGGHERRGGGEPGGAVEPRGEGRALLDVLASLPQPDGSLPSPRQVRDNVISVILAGHETTAAQLAWALQLLACNPRAQERLAAELDAGATGAGGGQRYLRATVRETLRHRSVFVFGIPRQVSSDVQLAGQTYSPPAQLLPCTYLLHHDPRRFPDPERFAPERFLEPPAGPRAFLPWGGGRRRCPGAQLATLELETVLRAVLTARVVEPVGTRIERPRWRSVIVAPRRGARVVLRERVAP
ncbi:MAG: cytochrome P450, partial [Solirubrobacteraceae bacterium]